MEVDLDLVLPEDIEIFTEKGSILQSIDFWQEPFRCHLCRCTGHIKVDFPFPSGDGRSLDIEEESPFGSASEKV